MESIRKFWKLYVILVALTLSPLIVWALDAAAAPDPAELAAGAVTALIPILTPIAVFWLRKLLTKIPRALIAPVVAPLVGVVLDFGLAWITDGQASWKWGAVLGCAGTWLRDVVTVAMKYGPVASNPDPKLLT